MTTQNDEFVNAYDTVHKMRVELGQLLDEAEDAELEINNTPEVRRKGRHLKELIYPIHEDLYQVEKYLKKE